VRGGDLDPPVGAEVGGGPVHLLGPAKAQVQNLGSGLHQALGHGVHEGDGGGADVAPQGDAPGPQRLGEGTADEAGHALVEVVAEAAPDVVGLEAGEGGHGSGTGLEFRQQGWAEPARLARG
jgi:hypothetical protein